MMVLFHQVWPPEGFTEIPWYFGPQNSLSRMPPSGMSGADRYTVNMERQLVRPIGGIHNWEALMSFILTGKRRI